MAIDSIGRTNTGAAGVHGYHQTVGGFGSIVQVVTDAEVSAASAAELLAPFSYATAGASRWIKRGVGISRAYFYARMDATATYTTSPVIRVFGAFPVTEAVASTDDVTPVTSSIANDGTWKAVRLDVADFNAAGLTLTLVASGSTLNNDATYAYSDETSEIDLQDCRYFLVLIETAAVIGAGSGAVSDAVPIYARCTA